MQNNLDGHEQAAANVIISLQEHGRNESKHKN